jgi:hypothetical protein
MANFSIKTKLEDMGINISTLDYTAIETFKAAVGNLAIAAQNYWIQSAQRKLRTSREIYVNGLRQSESYRSYSASSGADVFEVQLVGKMPNNFEFGMESFDMKEIRPGWLGGKKAKTAKDGSKYATIPFKHSTGNSPRFDYTGKAKEANLKMHLRNAVRNYGLNRMVRAASGAVKEGAVKRIPNNAAVHNYLSGLTRYQVTTRGTTQGGLPRGSSQLMTFRRISTKSDPESWIHPGLDGANILPMVESWVDQQMDKIIDVVLTGDE